MKDRYRDQEFLSTLRMLAPGTPLREGLVNVLRAGTGGLIVIGDNHEVLDIVDGGFSINCEYSPAYLYELAKMDGAIVISSDLKKILYANTQLVPDPSISTHETGIRHRTADRAAKQTNAVVIAISQRRNIITVYKGHTKYVLRDISIILAMANQAVQTLEKYRSVLDGAMRSLTSLEFENLATLYDAAMAVQRTGMVLRIVDEVERYICELGDEGSLITMQLNELIKNVESDGTYLVRDYHRSNDEAAHGEAMKAISRMDGDELLDLSGICRILGYPGDITAYDEPVIPRGYRILYKIPRLPAAVVENLVKSFDSFQKILAASAEELDAVEGIGEARARAIMDGLRKIRY
jgi:diadenylate cyclase